MDEEICSNSSLLGLQSSSTSTTVTNSLNINLNDKKEKKFFFIKKNIFLYLGTNAFAMEILIVIMELERKDLIMIR
jgi:hypothetical protein